jgi:hypothetical protein
MEDVKWMMEFTPALRALHLSLCALCGKKGLIYAPNSVNFVLSFVLFVVKRWKM